MGSGNEGTLLSLLKLTARAFPSSYYCQSQRYSHLRTTLGIISKSVRIMKSRTHNEVEWVSSCMYVLQGSSSCWNWHTDFCHRQTALNRTCVSWVPTATTVTVCTHTVSPCQRLEFTIGIVGWRAICCCCYYHMNGWKQAPCADDGVTWWYQLFDSRRFVVFLPWSWSRFVYFHTWNINCNANEIL